MGSQDFAVQICARTTWRTLDSFTPDQQSNLTLEGGDFNRGGRTWWKTNTIGVIKQGMLYDQDCTTKVLKQSSRIKLEYNTRKDRISKYRMGAQMFESTVLGVWIRPF